MFKVVQRFLATCLVWQCLLLSPSRAEEWSPPAASEAYEESKGLVGSLLNGPIEERLGAEFPEKVTLLRSIDVTVEGTPKIYGFSAIDGGRRRIILSSGIYEMVALYSRYAAILNTNGINVNNDCNKYIKYLTRIYNINRLKTSVSMDEFISEVESPDKFCGIERRSAIVDLRYAEVMHMTVVSVFAMILAHEVAHHLLGHLPPKTLSPSESKKREAEADRYGSILMGRIWRAPSAVVFTLLMNARQSHPFRPGRTYDAEECRFVFFIRDDIRIFGEPEGLRILDVLGSRVDLKEGAAEAIKVIKENRDSNGNVDCDILQ